jgi:hypothetical protein
MIRGVGTIKQYVSGLRIRSAFLMKVLVINIKVTTNYNSVSSEFHFFWCFYVLLHEDSQHGSKSYLRFLRFRLLVVTLLTSE